MAKKSTNEKQKQTLIKKRKINRRFTKKSVHPFDELQWDVRDAVITSAKGETVFSQNNVEVPKNWSLTATNIAASKYFTGKLNTPEREVSVKQLVGRVATTISEWGRVDGYFATEEEAETFEAELTFILVNQYAAFNSPVWFNVGFVKPKPQTSACFINSVKDDMRSILNLAVTEGMLFKYGSGTGTNLSVLRSSKEGLSTGGKASGPVSFMKGYDAFAGVISSGGRTRRAAKMVILDVDHPDILEFIDTKVKEEKKAHTLIDAGYEGGLNGDVYLNIFFQNANNSVRVSEEFMKAYVNDDIWELRGRTNGEVLETVQAKEVMNKICDAAWFCGDPGVQYDTTINEWHTCPNTDRIYASNPCSEYMFLNDSACNLSSLNLMKFYDGETFDVDGFKHSVQILITAQEILVSNSSYPTKAIEINSKDYRPLGLGYANLGSLLMANGFAYDSDEGRAYAAAITSLMSGHGYVTSSLIADKKGPFAGYQKNREPFLKVMKMHKEHAYQIQPESVQTDLYHAAIESWEEAYELGEKYGYRNAQISVLAPTGTIALLMDCDTTGVEPELALVKFKWLVGGGMMKFVNGIVSKGLRKLGYSLQHTEEIVAYVEKEGIIEGAPHLKDEHLPIFDCSFKPTNGKRFIQYMGHIKMMAAVQPFISGAISKTVNMPSDATPQEIADVYVQSWKLGLKAVAVYRDGSKRVQPLTTTKSEDTKQPQQVQVVEKIVEKIVERTVDLDGNEVEGKIKIVNKPARKKLPSERMAITHRFSIAGHEGYITAGMYDNGSLGEVFICMSKEGSTISGLMDSLATSVSIALQYGVPLKILVKKFVYTRYEPAGFTDNPEIRIAKSITDYIFRWLGLKFLSPEAQRECGIFISKEPEIEAKTTENEDNIEAKQVSGTEKSGPGDLTPVELKEPSKEMDPIVEKKEVQPPTATKVNVKEQSEADKNFVTFDSGDSPPCYFCGAIMVRNGSCYKCLNCGCTSGCS